MFELNDEVSSSEYFLTEFLCFFLWYFMLPPNRPLYLHKLVKMMVIQSESLWILFEFSNDYCKEKLQINGGHLFQTILNKERLKQMFTYTNFTTGFA
jgi:hypothetical protein